MNLEQMVEQIDTSSLKRDYQIYPLKRNSRWSKKQDLPFKEDLEYLYLEKNFSQQELSVYFNLVTIGKVIRSFGIEKPLPLKHQCRARQNLEKYGVDCPSKLEQTKIKYQQTCLEKYNSKSCNSLAWKKQKCENTCLEKYGVKNVSKAQNVREKISCGIKRTRTEHGFEIAEKTRLTSKERFGVPYYSQTNKWKQSIKEKKDLKFQEILFSINKDELFSFVRENKAFTFSQLAKKFSCSVFWIKKVLQFLKIEINPSVLKDGAKENQKLSMLEKHGVTNPSLMLDYSQKVYQTKKRNGTLNTSKPEDKLFETIKTKFPDVKRQYRDSRYPFSCDFYIPSQDLFIEYQGNWTHGGHPFNPNDKDDLNKVSLWKQKSQETNFKGKTKDYYANAIKVWTESDPLKRETALKNKLNWFEFFNERDFKDWFIS